MSVRMKTLLSAGLLSAGVIANPAMATNPLIYGDPVPNEPPEACNGISYEWTVNIGKPGKVEFVHTVGAKSWNEPPPFYTPPETGWTHTSNFIALNLRKASQVLIQVARQQGVVEPGTATLSGSKLYPAFTLWKGWEEKACEYTAHRYNNAGNNAWAPALEYIGNQPNAEGKQVVGWSGHLPAGKYTIAIGGANKSFCSPTDASCFTGRQGYRALITTK